MAPRTDGAEIVWGVSRLSRGWVEVKQAAEAQRFDMSEFGFVPQGEKALRVRISGLQPGTRYTYRAVTEAAALPTAREASDWREFRTLDATAHETHFAVWNDTHQNAETISRLHGMTPPVDFLLWNGDICNDWVKDELLVPTLLHPAGTDFTAQRPLAFVWGNHDVRGAYGFRLADYAAAPQGRPFYAFRSGPVAFVCLDTGEDKADAHPSFKGRVAFEPLRREQAQWLHNYVLATPELRDAPYRVLFCHIPLRWTDESQTDSYDWFSKRSRDLWHDALVKWGVQIVISGHTHEHAWLDPAPGFPYTQCVGGGPKPPDATLIEAKADGQALRFTMRALDGTLLKEAEFKPLV
jgi:hypothetical protein